MGPIPLTHRGIGAWVANSVCCGALVSNALKNYDSRNPRGRMSQKPLTRESRRSTRVPLKIVVVARSLRETLTCDGETILVNCHGALISSTIPLRVGMEIEIYVILT